MTAPVPALVDRLAAAGGSPHLTAYDAGGERVELSGAVLANWVAKTTNLLVEELDVAPGSTVHLDLPAHWRALVWALATWRAGGCVALGEGPADVVVTDRPAEHDADPLVAVSLPALTRRFEGTLPPGAIDAAAAVMTYGDVIGWTADTDPAAAAITVDGVPVDHAGLAAWAAEGTSTPAGARTLVECPADRSDVAGWLRTAVGILLDGGSLVLVGPSLAQSLAEDPGRRGHLVATERVTAEA